MVELTLVDAAAPEEAGFLTHLGGATGSSSLTVPSVEVPEKGPMAFALYQAPRDFVRPGSGDANERDRQISLRVRFTPQTGGASREAITPITIARPPVVLVHGLWGSRDSWNAFAPLTTDNRFFVQRLNYSATNAAGLDLNGNTSLVGDQLSDVVSMYKASEQVAAVQADVVAHSMGGLVVRMLPLLGQAFFRDNNFQLGDVHKLINIGTPHFGSPLARFLRRSQCVSDFLTNNGRPTNQGAIEDLVPNSQALNQINAISSPLELHQIVGLAGEQNKRDSENSTVLFLLGRIICRHDFRRIPSGTFFDTVLQTPEHDLIVPASSQRGGAITNVTPVPDVIHRRVALFLFGIEELESREISGRVIELLNTPTSEPDFASFQPVP
jgi:pimeloyl-ACP methyl ester carboxylesterase